VPPPLICYIVQDVTWEIAAREYILDICKVMQKQYQNTLDMDARICAEGEEQESINTLVNARSMAAAAVRVRERQVLNRMEYILRSQIREMKSTGTTLVKEQGVLEKGMNALEAGRGLFTKLLDQLPQK